MIIAFVKVGLHLHLYQPCVQEEDTFKSVVSQCYSPLIKYLKTKKNITVSADVSLSLLEQLDKYGYSSLINDIKALVGQQRIELVGSAAYHPLLTKIPAKFIEKQIVLNEYAQGFYFGSHVDFEGNPSVQIKDLRGFFAPELAINTEIVKTIEEFGYNWLIVDETALAGYSFGVYVLRSERRGGTGLSAESPRLGGGEIDIVCRDRTLSNMISFKRDSGVGDIMGYIKANPGDRVVALDGETFGHHNKEGFDLLDNLVYAFGLNGIALVSAGEVVSDLRAVTVDSVNESSWGASDQDMQNGNIYPMWYDKNNGLQMKMWELENEILSNVIENGAERAQKVDGKFEGAETVPVWKGAGLNAIADENVRKSVGLDLLLNKFLLSDKYWWLSKKEVGGSVLYHPGFVRECLKLARDYIKDSASCSASCSERALSLIDEIDREL